MNVKQSRSYNSPHREWRANATRQSILLAATSLFEQRGFAAVTMDQIARHAGVSIATVYIHFPGKPSIVSAMAEDIAMSPELSVELVEGEHDAVQQIRTGAHILRLLNERSWLVADILRTAAGTDPQLKEAWDRWQLRHLEAVRRGIMAMSTLRPGLLMEDAVAIFSVIGGTEVYRSLVRERGWLPERYERWLVEFACRELLDT